AGLTGGAAVVADVAAGSVLLSTTATGGTFVLQADAGGNTISTIAIPWNATAATVCSAVNNAGLAGIVVTTATGRGSVDAPWLLEGTGLTALRFNADGLEGGGLSGQFTQAGLRKVSTTATAGSFTLGVDVAGTLVATGPIAFNASTAGVLAALRAAAGLHATLLGGGGSAAIPWLIDVRLQPLVTGSSVVFRDAFGKETLGLLDGTAYAAVLLPATQQLRPGALLLRLAATPEQARVAEPIIVPLDTMVEFGDPVPRTMVGRAHTFSPLRAGSITVAAALQANDTGRSTAKNGGQPGFMDYLRPDMALASGGAKGLMTIMLTGGLGFLSKSYRDSFSQAVNNNAGNQQIAGNGAKSFSEVLGLSASVSYLQGTRSVRTILGPQAVLRTPGTIVIDTRLTEQFHTEAGAKVAKPSKTDVAIALAVSVAFVDTVCLSIVRSGAQLTGGSGVTIDSTTSYPLLGRVIDGTLDGFLPELKQNLFGTNSLGDIASGVGKTLEIPLILYRTQDGIHKTGASSGADQKEYLLPQVAKFSFLKNVFQEYQKNRDAVVSKALAGAVQTLFVDNSCEAIVEDGVQINHDPSVAAGSSRLHPSGSGEGVRAADHGPRRVAEREDRHGEAEAVLNFFCAAAGLGKLRQRALGPHRDRLVAAGSDAGIAVHLHPVLDDRLTGIVNKQRL
ncbi:MAG: hypothetical protein WCJ21_11380, partial [Planctomycetota bacterium]